MNVKKKTRLPHFHEYREKYIFHEQKNTTRPFQKGNPIFHEFEKGSPIFHEYEKGSPIFHKYKKRPHLSYKKQQGKFEKARLHIFQKEKNFEAEWILAYRFSAPANIFTLRRKPSWISFGK